MKRYDKYKDSGVDRIGEIPEHWVVNKFKSILTVHGRIGFRGYTVSDLVDKGEGAITISPSNMEEGKLNLKSSSYLSWDKYYESPEIMVKEGDFLLVKTASIGKLAYVKKLTEKATVNPQILILKNVKICRPFFFYHLLSSVTQKQLNTEKIGSTIFTISEQKIKNFSTILPPLSEQQAIASFLDDKTSKIDQTISIKEKEIELLKERHQILIQKTVTKGLDDKVKLKDSGVEWIGEVPEHWEVRKLMGVCRFIRGNSPFGKDELLEEGEYVAIQYGKTYKVNEVNKEYGYYVNNEFYKKSQVVSYGDIILISTSETIDDLGHTVYYRRNDLGLLGGEQIMLKPKQEEINGQYLYFTSKVFSKELRKFATGIKVFRFNINDLKTIFTVLPPLSEQNEIANYIETKSTKISKAISLKQQEIERLREYKTVLIDNVVTGKISVC
ncbi:restriction endonuclease subunit S [Elizabethkingia anophelis]|uniref:restriction endonuclease subunit S n=1 Tax=Elizabethkingia anophelis TaxID=1117645 RepID=UPI00293C1EEF|nr:hypothetical protein [Elizabethkingia anophelis]